MIEPYTDGQRGDVVALSLRAWAPVFDALRNELPAYIFQAFYRGDWQGHQRASVESVCDDPDAHVWTAIEENRLAGFVALKLHPEDQMGEIYMIAVDPDFQRRGVAAALMRHADAWFEEAGMAMAMVETGGDSGHGPARQAYESAGYRILPVARYFKEL